MARGAGAALAARGVGAAAKYGGVPEKLSSGGLGSGGASRAAKSAAAPSLRQSNKFRTALGNAYNYVKGPYSSARTALYETGWAYDALSRIGNDFFARATQTITVTIQGGPNTVLGDIYYLAIAICQNKVPRFDWSANQVFSADIDYVNKIVKVQIGYSSGSIAGAINPLNGTNGAIGIFTSRPDDNISATNELPGFLQGGSGFKDAATLVGAGIGGLFGGVPGIVVGGLAGRGIGAFGGSIVKDDIQLLKPPFDNPKPPSYPLGNTKFQQNYPQTQYIAVTPALAVATGNRAISYAPNYDGISRNTDFTQIMAAALNPACGLPAAPTSNQYISTSSNPAYSYLQNSPSSNSQLTSQLPTFTNQLQSGQQGDQVNQNQSQLNSQPIG
jgi:hypothetical protein